MKRAGDRESMLAQLHRRGLRLLGAVVAVMLLSHPVLSADSASKTANSFPDVWGVELPLPEGVHEIDLATLYSGPGLPAVVLYGVRYVDGGVGFRLFDVFARKLLASWAGPGWLKLKGGDGKTVEEFLSDHGLRQVRSVGPLPDGGRMLQLGGGYLGYYLERRSANRKVVFRKAIVRVANQTRTVYGPRDDFTDGRREIPVHANTGVPYPYLLDDGTFLLLCPPEPFVIRFRPDFTSPFIDHSDEFLMVDPALTERLVDEGLRTVIRETTEEMKKPDGRKVWIVETIDAYATTYLKKILAEKIRGRQ